MTFYWFISLKIKAECYFCIKLKNSYIFYRRTVYLKTKIIKLSTAIQ